MHPKDALNIPTIAGYRYSYEMNIMFSNTFIQKVVDDGGDITILRLNISAFVISILVILFIWFMLIPKLKNMYLEIILDQQKKQVETLRALLKNKDTIDHE